MIINELYHFIGIKGTGMSALACIMHDLGYKVQGSDYEDHYFTQEPLDERHILCLPFNDNNIREKMIIIIGDTFRNHSEVLRAQSLGLVCYDYNEMLGELTKKYETIAISGCHGKSTTTAMMAHVFKNTIGCNYLIGDGTGYASKKHKTFIIEACEYKRHFLKYYLKNLVITNIELDHVDYFKDLADVKSAYYEFSQNVSGKIVTYGEDENIRSLNLKNAIYYGFNHDNDVYATNIQNTDYVTFDVYINKEYYDKFKIQLFGSHQILNALAVITMAHLENIPKEKIKKHLETFTGAKRRFDETKVKDVVLVDDYAHHPTEVKATIETARLKYPHKQIIAVFQGHTFTRTKKIYKEICNVLTTVDKAYFPQISPAREKQEDYPDVSNHLFLANLKDSEEIDINTINKLLEYKNAVVLFMSPKEMKEYIIRLKELIENES